MDLLDKGKHCEEEFCHQLDFLPIECKLCRRHFCSEHFKYERHGCEKASAIDFKVPTCELCNEVIEFKRGKHMDLCLSEHLAKFHLDSDDKRESATQSNAKPKKNNNKCIVKGCRSKDIINFECERCANKFCNRHRLPEVHMCAAVNNNLSCSSQAANPGSSRGIFAKLTSRLLTQY